MRRVSNRVAVGSTLVLALAAEGNPKVNEETWKKALSAHPEFSPLYEAAKGKFLDEAMQRLARDSNLQNLRWLLERRHAEMFARPETLAAVVNVSQHQHVGIPADVLERARAISEEEQKAESRKLKAGSGERGESRERKAESTKQGAGSGGRKEGGGHG